MFSAIFPAHVCGGVGAGDVRFGVGNVFECVCVSVCVLFIYYLFIK